MKRFLTTAAIITTCFLFSGCGQDLQVTVYSMMPLYGQEWAGINANTQHYDGWFYPTDYALTTDQINDNNSITFKSHENDTLSVSAKGQYYVIDSQGNSSLSNFQVPVFQQVLYGGLLDQPHWYAEVNLGTVIIFRK